MKKWKIIELSIAILILCFTFSGCQKNIEGNIDNTAENEIEVTDGTAVNETKITDSTDKNEIEIDESEAFVWEGTVLKEYKGNSTNVIIPEQCTKIDRIAFFLGSDNIKSIYIPAGVTEIEDNPFYECKNLESITVAPENPNYTSEEGILYNKDKTLYIAYPNAKERKKLVIPDHIVDLTPNAFETNFKIEEVVLNDTMTAEGGFSLFFNLKLIEVSPNNERYTSIDGILYDKSLKTLVAYGSGRQEKVFAVPNHVTHILGGAFGKKVDFNGYINTGKLETVILPDYMEEGFQILGGRGLKCIVIPGTIKSEINFPEETDLEKVVMCEGIKSIGDFAFWKSYDLKYVSLPEGLTQIGENAFRSCGNIKILVLPNSIETIGGAAFRNMFSLDYVIVKGKTKQEMEEPLVFAEYNSRNREEDPQILTGLDVTVDEKKVFFDYSSPFIDDKGKIQIPIQYVLDALGIQSRWENGNKTIFITKEDKEIKINLGKVQEIEEVVYCQMDKLEKIMKMYDIHVDYNRDNYEINLSTPDYRKAQQIQMKTSNSLIYCGSVRKITNDSFGESGVLLLNRAEIESGQEALLYISYPKEDMDADYRLVVRAYNPNPNVGDEDVLHVEVKLPVSANGQEENKENNKEESAWLVSDSTEVPYDHSETVIDGDFVGGNIQAVANIKTDKKAVIAVYLYKDGDKNIDLDYSDALVWR